MQKKSPFDVILSRHVTEKSSVLHHLQYSEANPSVKKCTTPKYVFLVDKRANKQEIAKAVEEIYSDRKVKVLSVNTITIKPKARKLRGRPGFKAGFKKAVVTLGAGQDIGGKV